MSLALFLLHDKHTLEVQVVLLLQDVEKWRVRATINADLLELVAEVILDGLLLKLVSFVQDIVFAFKDEAVDDEVFFLEQI